MRPILSQEVERDSLLRRYVSYQLGDLFFKLIYVHRVEDRILTIQSRIINQGIGISDKGTGNIMYQKAIIKVNHIDIAILVQQQQQHPILLLLHPADLLAPNLDERILRLQPQILLILLPKVQYQRINLAIDDLGLAPDLPNLKLPIQ